eukprot:XP_001708547.1 Hypothetical protein GL50803_35639 [Giardia lamblia ATCC 50803]
MFKGREFWPKDIVLWNDRYILSLANRRAENVLPGSILIVFNAHRFSFRRYMDSSESIHDRRLPSPVSSEQGKDFVVSDLEGDVLDCVVPVRISMSDVLNA